MIAGFIQLLLPLKLAPMALGELSASFRKPLPGTIEE